MPEITNGVTLKHMTYNGQKVKKWYHNGAKVFSAGNVVTYYVNTGVFYQEEVDSEASCLSPKTFTPAISGWTFVGWREDTTASGSVLSSKVMGDEPITLYAVFSQNITVTYYNGSTTASSASGKRYYNNGNVANPSFTLTQKALSGWTARGWSTGTAGNSGISYNNGATFTRDSSVTLYGMYYLTITVTYYNGSASAKTTSGYRYYNSNGQVVNPSFTLTQAALSGWTARGWSTGTAGNSGITYNNGTAFTRTSNVTLYGMYYQTITVKYHNWSTTASSTSGTRYYNSNGNVINPSFALTQTTVSGWTARGWSTGSAGNSGITYNNGATFTRDSSVTLYGMWYQTISLSYNGNGASSGSVATQYGNIYVSPGFSQINPTFTLSANGFARTSCSFTKWALGSAGGTQYAAGSAVTLAASSVCYALWTVSVKTTSLINTNSYQMAIYPNDINAVRISNGIDASLYSGATLALGEVSGSENFAWCWFTAGIMSSTSTTVHSSSPGTARVHVARYDDENTVKYYENTNVTINFAETSGTVYLFAGVTGYKTSDEGGGGYGSWGFKFTSSAITLIPRF